MADEPGESPSFDLGALDHSIRKETDGTTERAAFLEQLRKKIKAGEYRVDSQALADRLLERAAGEILPDHCPEDPEDDAK